MTRKLEYLLRKLERLLRFHRQRVFDTNGAAHERAIRRLKATATAREVFYRRHHAAMQRMNAILDRRG